VEEVCVFISQLKPETSRFLLPIVLLLTTGLMKISVQLMFFFQRDGVYREEICLDLVLFQGLLRFHPLMEGGFERFGPGFKS
jgi:hypothetical protein